MAVRVDRVVVDPAKVRALALARYKSLSEFGRAMRPPMVQGHVSRVCQVPKDPEGYRRLPNYELSSLPRLLNALGLDTADPILTYLYADDAEGVQFQIDPLPGSGVSIDPTEHS